MILGPRHREMLLACWQYRLLTASDFQQLLNLKSRPHVRRLLGELCGGADGADREYLFRVPLPQTRTGGTEKAYFLGSRGRDYLAREEGLPVVWYWRPGKARQHISYGHLIHDLTVNRFLISLHTWCNAQQHIRLAEIRTQYELAHTIPTQEGITKVVPDAWVNVELLRTNGAKPEYAPLLIEIDRGSQYSHAFKDRLLSRLAFIRSTGPYSTIFGTKLVTIVYLTTAGVMRRNTMARWGQEILAQEKRQDWAEVFLFGSVQFETFYEQAPRLFTEPVWRRPDGGAPVHLFG
jgi:hypothetical protein